MQKKLHGGRQALSRPDSQVDLCVTWTANLDKLSHLVALCPPAFVALINRVVGGHSVWGVRSLPGSEWGFQCVGHTFPSFSLCGSLETVGSWKLPPDFLDSGW